MCSLVEAEKVLCKENQNHFVGVITRLVKVRENFKGCEKLTSRSSNINTCFLTQ